MKRVLTVRKNKVRQALHWLVKHHSYFRTNVQIDDSALEALPEDDVPEPLWETIVVSTDVEQAEQERRGYAPDPLTHVQTVDDHTSEVPLAPSGVVDVNGVSVTSEDITTSIMERVRSESSKTAKDDDVSTESNKDDDIYVVPHASKPANEYRNPQLLTALFPVLFPYGCCGIEDDRPVSVSFKAHVQYRKCT